ncbi:MAG: oligoendopeptidase F [Spirochaetaceae bacterium]
MSGIPQRSELPQEDKWDLSSLYTEEKQWDRDLELLEGKVETIESFKGRLGESAEELAQTLEYMNEVGILEERLGYFAMLRKSEDASDSENQARFDRFMRVATRVDAAASYQRPEIQAIPDEKMEEFLAHPRLEQFKIFLSKLRRFRPHILSQEEEKLLSMQQEANQTAQRTFQSLVDVDLEFGTVKTSEGEEKPLTQSTFITFLQDPDRGVREEAHKKFYRRFEEHKHTLASLYAGSIQLDIYKARVRNYPSARAMALFPDKVDESVYDNLVRTIRENLPTLHRYYALRKRLLGIEDFAHFDTRVPLVPEIQVRHSYEEAVELVTEALQPLGEEYVSTLRSGLLGGWVDRYENKGKRSGAFSAGSFVGWPYILMNYKEEVLRDVFTLAHEAGHSMHSYYSSKNNPFQHYDYTIFEAEVASTFNEQLLNRHLLEKAKEPRMQAYLINKELDDLVATLFRQTMFAEFEDLVHKHVESGNPATLDYFRESYGSLLSDYFGPEVSIDDPVQLEGLRIPHFYRAFYVYKYSTGISAAISLSKRVLAGGARELEDYFAFLKSGGSRFPLESLGAAGVDMSRPEPIQEAMSHFGSRLKQLEGLLEA